MHPEHLIQTLGLPGLVLGAVVEGDTVTFLGGVLAHRHLFPFEAVALAATLGGVIADNICFLIGRRAGQGALARRVLARPAARALHSRLTRHPEAAILGVRFLYGMKTVGAMMVGTTAIPWARFAAINAVAVLIWAHVLAALGYGAGAAIVAAFGHHELHIHLGVALLVFVLGAALLWPVIRWRRKRKDGGS
ncbi:DedA family protein [Salipiger sp.]|uniref:DedA family protein n=1 Tax=Salipiger sp. TaxID=2078585 RepID=UPI003A983044